MAIKVDLTSLSIYPTNIVENHINSKWVEIDFDRKSKIDSSEYNEYVQFESIEDVKTFILELWEVAKETWNASE